MSKAGSKKKRFIKETALKAVKARLKDSRKASEKLRKDIVVPLDRRNIPYTT